MNLIEKLIEAEIKETERLCKDIQPDSEYYNDWQKILTDLRNALQEYRDTAPPDRLGELVEWIEGEREGYMGDPDALINQILAKAKSLQGG